MTAGYYTSPPSNSWTWLLYEYLQQRDDNRWILDVHGCGGSGSIALNPDWNYQMTPRRSSWQAVSPDVAIIEFSANNLPQGYDDSARLPGGYTTHQEAMDWYKTDVVAGVDWLVNTKGMNPANILILGQWPMGSDYQFDGRGERFIGGTSKGWVGLPDTPAGENLWRLWNYGTATPGATFDGIQKIATDLGCTFIDMSDVYGAAYNPVTDAAGYVYQTDESFVHVTNAGAQKWADLLIPRLPIL